MREKRKTQPGSPDFPAARDIKNYKAAGDADFPTDLVHERAAGPTDQNIQNLPGLNHEKPDCLDLASQDSSTSLSSDAASPKIISNQMVSGRKSQNSSALFLEGLKASIPVTTGYFAVSAAYGMAAIIQGMTVNQAVITSLTCLTSAGQFAGTTLICAGASLLELIATQLVINARYFLMSISLAQKTGTRIPLAQRLLMAYGITDEIYAIAISQKGTIRFAWFMGLVLGPVIGWSAGTWLGASASNILPADLVNALGLSMYGMFIAIFVPAARKNKAVLCCVLLAIGLSCLFAFIPGLNELSDGYAIIIITVIVSAIMAWKFPRREDQEA